MKKLPIILLMLILGAAKAVSGEMHYPVKPITTSTSNRSNTKKSIINNGSSQGKEEKKIKEIKEAHVFNRKTVEGDSAYGFIRNGIYTVTTNANAKQAYTTLLRKIKDMEESIKQSVDQNPDAKPKDPFETSQEYALRKERLNNWTSNKRNILLKPYLDLLDSSAYTLIRLGRSSLKIDVKLENYNADKQEWKIGLYEANNYFSTCVISIPPNEAKIFWSNKDQIKVYRLQKISGKSEQFYQVNYGTNDQSIILEKYALSPNPVGDDGVKIFTKVEIEASFPGGESAWLRYLEKNLHASTPVDNGAPEGTYQVIVRFIVSKDGSISDVTAETNHGFGMEQEAVKIIKKGPKWRSAFQFGKNVNAYRRQPITFTVQDQ